MGKTTGEVWLSLSCSWHGAAKADHFPPSVPEHCAYWRGSPDPRPPGLAGPDCLSQKLHKLGPLALTPRPRTSTRGAALIYKDKIKTFFSVLLRPLPSFLMGLRSTHIGPTFSVKPRPEDDTYLSRAPCLQARLLSRLPSSASSGC